MYSHELLVGGHNSAGSIDFYFETPSTELGNAFSNSLKKTREGHVQRGE
jgi:formaldehyde-activating enzyme involved in methanogenesis